MNVIVIFGIVFVMVNVTSNIVIVRMCYIIRMCLILSRYVLGIYICLPHTGGIGICYEEGREGIREARCIA